MAERKRESKFAGLREGIAQAKAQAQPEAHQERRRDRAKSTDPAWKQHTILLSRKNHVAACAILLQRDNGTDLSDLLDNLLGDWVQQQQAKA